MGIKYWWDPWLLGCKKMLLLIYFGKIQTSQCKSVAAPQGTGGTGGDLGDWGTVGPVPLVLYKVFFQYFFKNIFFQFFQFWKPPIYCYGIKQSLIQFKYVVR